MTDDHGGLHAGCRLGERREVGGADREDHFAPAIAFFLQGELVVRHGGAAANAVKRHTDDLAVRCDLLLQDADRFTGNLKHHAGAVIKRLRRRQRVEDGAEGADNRHPDFLHFDDERRLRAAQAETEDAENLVALHLLFRGGHGAIGAQAVVVDRHRNLAAVDAAAVVERLYVQIKTLPCRRVGPGERAGQIRDVTDFIVLSLRRQRGGRRGRQHREPNRDFFRPGHCNPP